MQNQPRKSLAVLEQGYLTMERAYQTEPQRVGPWQAALGVLIGDHYQALAQPKEAELWYRRVLEQAPLQADATVRLAQLLRSAGDNAQANRICQTLHDKVGVREDCAVRSSD